MRWLYHLLPSAAAAGLEQESGAPYAPPSLAREGFIHASYGPALLESARLYFAPGTPLTALQVDPRRLDVRVEEALTPRGPMPHIHGPLPRDAIRARLAPEVAAAGPDRVTGTRFALVAFEGMTLLDLVAVLDPLSRIRSMGIDPSASCEVVGYTGPVVWAQSGARVEVERVRPPLHAYDVVVVPGGPGTRALVEDAPLREWLAEVPDNRLLASVCTGSLLLAAAGKLRGHRATTHARALEELRALGVEAVEARLVDSGQRVTGGGGTCGLDVGLHLVERLEGAEAARTIAKQMALPSGWGGGT
ncbi:DUF952 domain-containing protein [Aggregicoccus sp. 17bor-14]|uniref:DUF952 domain-containing protein n=1 Tax=Myxococcaceae TaxID=31 RepID=UPI00129CF08D|nr:MULTISPECIES: DUF952 domain-containing protein [Myxococcaceae]MBF5046215.1 DUF952 domain-containing protein [Simulacricoccus sp. 17bor-14]MRI91939.1 DUF952 domain-containing protein [Aggregicoccus sp. 17bor-14]